MAKIIEKKDGLTRVKHLKNMVDVDGKDVSVIDWVEDRPVDDLLTEAEDQLKRAEKVVSDLKEDIVEFKKIKG